MLTYAAQDICVALRRELASVELAIWRGTFLPPRLTLTHPPLTSVTPPPPLPTALTQRGRRAHEGGGGVSRGVEGEEVVSPRRQFKLY